MLPQSGVAFKEGDRLRLAMRVVGVEVFLRKASLCSSALGCCATIWDISSRHLFFSPVLTNEGPL